MIRSGADRMYQARSSEIGTQIVEIEKQQATLVGP